MQVQPPNEWISRAASLWQAICRSELAEPLPPLHCARMRVSARRLLMAAHLVESASGVSAMRRTTTCVGITGGIAMGKSTTTNFLREVFGVPVHDADAAVHRLYGVGGAAVGPIRDAFGSGVISADGSVDRGALGAYLASLEPEARKQGAFGTLTKIVHPLVAADRDAFLAKAKAEGRWLVGVDIPLLFETLGDGAKAAGIDHVLAVTCGSAAEQRRRALARPGMTEAKLDAILARQLGDDERTSRADSVVDTSFFDVSRARAMTVRSVAPLYAAPPVTFVPARSPRAVSFDLDNTFWPTVPPLLKLKGARPPLLRKHMPSAAAALGGDDEALEASLDAFERDRPKGAIDADIKHDITARRRLFFRDLAERHGDAAEAADALVADFVAMRTDATDAFLVDEALPAVAALKARGLAVGALTNGNARRAGRLGDVLDFWLTAADVGAMKPNVAPFLAACHAAACDPDELVHVGDSLNDDVLGALRFGCRAVHVSKLADPDDPALLAEIEGYDQRGRLRRVATVADVDAALADWL